MPHRIRLHGPWQLYPGNLLGQRFNIPNSIRTGGLTNYFGEITFGRHFGCPTNLSPSDHVWLVFDRVVGEAQVQLNGRSIGALSGSGRFEVTGRLEKRNVLEVKIDVTSDDCGITGEVALLIEASGAA